MAEESQVERPVELFFASLQTRFAEVMFLQGHGRFAQKGAHKLIPTPEGNRMLVNWASEILSLTNPERDSTIHSMVSQGGRQKMVATETISEATSRLLLKSPAHYYRHFCFVCHREWIASEQIVEGKSPKLPKKCTYRDCRSMVWNDPIKGEAKRIDWLANREKRKGKP